MFTLMTSYYNHKSAIQERNYAIIYQGRSLYRDLPWESHASDCMRTRGQMLVNSNYQKNGRVITGSVNEARWAQFCNYVQWIVLTNRMRNCALLGTHTVYRANVTCLDYLGFPLRRDRLICLVITASDVILVCGSICLASVCCSTGESFIVFDLIW